ncbi:NADPH:adrenodoxin oxidoreductase mitochondrial precursor [Bimuria novae-zelandiae CBS 107.79]|uniref:NADPH:adrenodoxin oxidoreductase, mitochondrial n=1 Tax=Bimuria novae-zelandiae CBS 107.79 TaxID=1447943 RepID=A0A6A5VHB5_9PLEO|nr:NADPH:adrenodoxin oxidoreductase mitochondrial precursor [Bimuria novae-zelandiae CBS 107.79]
MHNMHYIHQARRAPYICASCIRNLDNGASRITRTYATYRSGNRSNDAVAEYLNRRPSLAAPRALHLPQNASPLPRNAYSATKKPMRLAIIGSGPAGFYSAHRLMKQVPDAMVDMYEKLPVPYGLVRFGVAPDHPEVKNCQDTFEEVAASDRFNYIGNVEVGQSLALADMKPHYDAILFAYGATEDKKLGIPGEDLSGVYSAREFVGWYNGHPELSHLTPQLDQGDHAVIIGQGNVALDVARILLQPPHLLKHTDIAEHALAVLSRSKVRRIQVAGRRGPLQAAFTIKEARELMHFPKVGFKSDAKKFYPRDLGVFPRAQKRLAEVLLKGSHCDGRDHKRRWELSFMRSPQAIRGDNHVTGVDFQKTAFAPDADPLSKGAKVVPTNEWVQSPASVVFRSVGYKSTALPGLSELGALFDEKLGIIPNDAYGRVISPSKGPGALSAGHLPGLYAVGWVKRGPTGVIVSTMMDAFTTGDVIAADWKADAQFLNTEKGVNKSTGLGWDGVRDKVLAKGVIPVDWEAWKKIDQAERARGKEKGKLREKFTDFEQMKMAAGLS